MASSLLNQATSLLNYKFDVVEIAHLHCSRIMTNAIWGLVFEWK